MIEFDSACRICLEHGATFPIFESEEVFESLHAKLTRCLKEKIEDIKGYPRNICVKCKTTVDTVCSFLTKFQETCKILQNKVVNVKTEINDDCDISNDDGDDGDNKDSFSLQLAIEGIKVEPVVEEKKDPTELLESLQNLTVKRIKIGDDSTSQDSNCVPNEDFKKRKRGRPTKAKKDEPKKVVKKPKQQPKNVSIKATNIATKHVPKNKTRAVREKLIKAETEVEQDKVDLPASKLCHTCGATFYSSHKLGNHYRTVHIEKKFKCLKCPKRYLVERELQNHVLSHENIRNFICEECGKGFTMKKCLISHIKVVHKKVKRVKKTVIYKCNFCDKSFKYKKGVTVHQRSVHTGERPFVCSVCGSSFYDQSYLTEHMRLHTGATPNKCPVCGRGYAQRGNMKSHMRNHKISQLDPDILAKLKPSLLKYLRP